MIPKSGHRFSDKIMLKEYSSHLRRSEYLYEKHNGNRLIP